MLYGVVLIVAVVVIGLGISRLAPALPGVDAGTVWTAVVERGEMVRQVRGPGTLIPEETWWVPSGPGPAS